jgi:hypothetical protein
LRQKKPNKKRTDIGGRYRDTEDAIKRGWGLEQGLEEEDMDVILKG